MARQLDLGNVRLILPERSMDDVSEALRYLTETICLNRIGDDCDGGGGLGGDYGYGVNFENETFMLHRYCWCERDDCPWCAGCECPESAYHYFVDGQEVTYEEWAAFYCREMGPRPALGSKEMDAYLKKAEKVNERRAEKHDAVCRVCRGEFGNAPNFLYKPTGARVRWYKWIGRDNEVSGDLPQDFLNVCIKSLQETP